MSMTFRELLRRARQEIMEVDAAQVYQALKDGADVTVLDVREQAEFSAGHIEGAISMPRGFLEMRIEGAVPDRDRPLILCCQSGIRSILAAKTLKELGYNNVMSLSGGMTSWQHRGYPVFIPHTLTEAQRRRYDRHLKLPEVGEKGQLKLMAAKVLCLGAGGLGSPAALYLAAAGVGKLGIVDSDAVDETNLQRQILHNTPRIGAPKSESAMQTLTELNPEVEVVPYQLRLTRDNVMDIFSGYDIIVNGTDNFPTRYMTNDAAILLGKPIVDGSIFRFEGMVTVFYPGRGPCYRCLFPQPPDPAMVPS